MKQMRYLKILLPAALAAAGFYAAVAGLDRGQAALGRDQLENALRRAAVACYAVEGVYPEDLAHLARYGVQIDNNRYIVHYEVFADNLMPDITVLDREE